MNASAADTLGYHAETARRAARWALTTAQQTTLTAVALLLDSATQYLRHGDESRAISALDAAETYGTCHDAGGVFDAGFTLSVLDALTA
jgi:hypothetical protein